MTRLVCLPVALIAAITCQLVLAQTPQGGASATTGTAKLRQLTIHNKEWTGDFDKMLERRMIRVYAPFSRSLYFNDNGRERGIAVARLGALLEHQVRQTASQATPHDLHRTSDADKLLPYLREGLADVAIGNLTITEERLKEADFVPGDEGRRTHEAAAMHVKQHRITLLRRRRINDAKTNLGCTWRSGDMPLHGLQADAHTGNGYKRSRRTLQLADREVDKSLTRRP